MLYTALVASHADIVLVLSSREGALQIPGICEKAGFDSSRIRAEIVEDPHGCFQNAARLVLNIRPLLLIAGEVTINITGGTTALQYLVEKIGREAERLGIGVRPDRACGRASLCRAAGESLCGWGCCRA